MLDFTYFNPTRIIFGKGKIAELTRLVPRRAKVLLVYGRGSIKENGVYDQISAALEKFDVIEFGGIEPNPRYETCMEAVEVIAAEGPGFIVGAGGGSVFDACKYIAASARFAWGDPWEILSEHKPVKAALPWGGVLTLPATGSEMNAGSVISRDGTQEKLVFASDLVRPRFSILDPETTYSLPPRQTANGVVDAFVHVCEQYATTPAASPLQDRQAEAVLLTLIEEGPKALKEPRNYDVRANLMWCATNALNGWLGLGVSADWATHVIGHELTVLYGVDHAQSLAIVQPGVWRHQRDRKREKLLQYGARVWNITDGTEEERVDRAISETESFYRSLGVGTRLRDYDIPEEACDLVAGRLAKRGVSLGEHSDIGAEAVREILRLRV